MPIRKGQQLSGAHRQAIREGIARKMAHGYKPDASKAREGLAKKREKEKAEHSG